MRRNVWLLILILVAAAIFFGAWGVQSLWLTFFYSNAEHQLVIHAIIRFGIAIGLVVFAVIVAIRASKKQPKKVAR
jgi:hypothetical protein